MGGKWQRFMIRDVSKVVTGKTPSGTLPEFFDGETLFVTPTDMNASKYIDNTLRTLSSSGEEAINRVVFDKGIVVSCIGWQMGKSSIVRRKAATNQQINTVIPDESVIDFDFLYYVISSKRQEIFDLGSTATRTPILKKSLFEKIEFIAPSKQKQKRIASILSSLDNMINLNHQTNQTLEQMAQAIFKCWFVDFEPVRAKAHVMKLGGTRQQCEMAAQAVIAGALSLSAITEEKELATLDQNLTQALESTWAKQTDEQKTKLAETAMHFPDGLVESDLGEIPVGWRLSTIGDEVRIFGGGTPSTKNEAFWAGGTINWTTPKDLSGSNEKILLKTDRKITDEGLNKISSGLLPENTVLMSSRAPVGYLALTKIPLAVNQGYIAMRCEGNLSPEFVIQWAESIMDDVKQRSSGTTFAEISKKNFRVIPVLVPKSETIDVYSIQVRALYDMITNNIKESEELSETRDSLLPKLLSGQIEL